MGLLDIINPSTKTIKESYERLKLKEQGLEKPSLLGAIRDPQFRSDVVRGLLDAGNRGAVAGTIGAPVDLATMVMRLGGYNVEKPMMGSEWIGDKMRQAGFVSDNRNPVAEALAGVALPAAGAKLAPKVFAAEQVAKKGLLQAGDNLMAPTTLNRQMGKVAISPQEQAREYLAYHGTQRAPNGLESFGGNQSGYYGQDSAGAFWTTSNPESASNYANWIKGQGNPTVYPVKVSMKKPASIQDHNDAVDYLNKLASDAWYKKYKGAPDDVRTAAIDEYHAAMIPTMPEESLYNKALVDELKRRGFDGVRFEYAPNDIYNVTFDPNQVRSVFDGKKWLLGE